MDGGIIVLIYYHKFISFLPYWNDIISVKFTISSIVLL